MAKDLVCGMEVQETENAVKAEYDGKECYFCSESCRDKFMAEPVKYVQLNISSPETGTKEDSGSSKKFFITNESKADRILRAVIGLALIFAGAVSGGTAGIILGIIGLISVITSITGFCMIYRLLNISTRK